MHENKQVHYSISVQAQCHLSMAMLFMSTPVSKQATLALSVKGRTYIFANKINSVDQIHLEYFFFLFCFPLPKFKPFVFLPIESDSPSQLVCVHQKYYKKAKTPWQTTRSHFWLLCWWAGTPWYEPQHNSRAGRCSFQEGSFLYRSFRPNEGCNSLGTRRRNSARLP